MNANFSKKGLKELTADYEPGYLNGSIVTYKPGHQLRSIISEVTTPTYETTKQLDNIIKPYIHSKHMLKSRGREYTKPPRRRRLIYQRTSKGEDRHNN